MYYSYYCNEKMLLDNFDDYNESPRLLRRLLAQSGYEPDFVQICSWPIQTPST